MRRLSFPVIAIALLCSAQRAPADVIDDSLISWQTFSTAGTFLLDTAPGGTATHNGVNRGATSSDTVAGRGGVATFAVTTTGSANGSQFTVPASADFDTATGTIAFWMNSTGNTGVGSDGSILFDHRTSSGDVVTLANDGRLFVQAVQSGAGVRNSFYSNGTVNNGQWRHVAYVFDQAAGGSTALYIDGVLSRTQTNTGAWTWPASQQLEIGKSHDAY